MLMILPEILWCGTSIAYYSGQLVNIMSYSLASEVPPVSDDNQFFYSMLAMIWFGIGEVLGCVYIGQVIDRYGSKIATIHICVIILIMGGLTIVYIILNHYYTGLAYAMCFFWGV